MKDTDELRALIDEIAMTIPAVIQMQGTLRSKHNTSGNRDMGAYSDQIDAYTQAREGLISLDTRLLLRLGYEDPVREACALAVKEISDAGADVMALVALEQPPPDDWPERSQRERKAMLATQQRFLEKASEFVSSPARSLRRPTQ